MNNPDVDFEKELQKYLDQGGRPDDLEYQAIVGQRNDKIVSMTPAEAEKYGVTDEYNQLQSGGVQPQKGTGLQGGALDPYAQRLADLKARYDSLRQSRMDSSTAALQKLRDNALSGLDTGLSSAMTAYDTEQAGIAPKYYDKRNQAAGASDVGAMNFAQYMASRGIKGSAGAMPEVYRNIGLQGQIGALNQQEAAANADVGRRRANTQTEYATKRADVNNAYESDLAQANADIESDVMQQYLDAMAAMEAQRAADLAAQGKTSTGEMTMAGQNNERQNYVNTLGQYYNDYDAQIKAVQNDNDPSNDWQVGYLQNARQQKLQSQAEAQATAWDNAMKLWPQLTNGATPEIANILGVPVGAKAADYDIAKMNADTSRMNAQTAQTNANKTKASDYDYNTDPSFQSDVSDIVNGVSTLDDVKANAAALQAAYGYDGYMELVKLATPAK